MSSAQVLHCRLECAFECNRISVAMSLFIVTVVASTKEISSKVLTCSYIASTKVLERSGAF